jgi:hypothetical protein
MKIQAPHPTDKKMVVALLKKQMYDHNENPSPPPPPSTPQIRKWLLLYLKL